MNEKVKIPDILVNEVTFPDQNFRKYVLSLLKKKSINKVKHIDVSNYKIKNLEGIEYFTSLVSLNCNSNLLTTLNLSSNEELITLYCNENRLTTLNISKNTSLVTLYCTSNRLKELNIQNNIVLKDLRCDDNKLKQLDTSKNALLEFIGCDNNQLKKIDTNKNVALQVLSCCNNQLTIFDFRLNSNLYGLACKHNCFLSLDLPVYRYKLFEVDHQERLLTLHKSEKSIDLSKLEPFMKEDCIHDLQGANIKKMILSDFIEGRDITYNYDCGLENLMDVTIKLKVK